MVLPLDTFLFCRVGRHHISTQQAWRSQAMLNVCFASFDVLFATCFYYEQQFPFHSFIRLLVTSTQHACWLWQTLTLTSASTRVSWSCHHVIRPDNRLRWWWSRVLIVRMPGLIMIGTATSPGTRTSSPSWSLVTPSHGVPGHTVSRCHHLHICFNQHMGSSLGINNSDMRDYKWFESIKVMYFSEVVFIFSSFLMIFMFSPIPIPHPTKFSLRCLPNIMEDCFCQYYWIDININISQEKSYQIKERYRNRTQHMTWTSDCLWHWSLDIKHQTMTALLIFSVINISDGRISRWRRGLEHPQTRFCDVLLTLFSVVTLAGGDG